jgi:hypothetical protein
MAASLVLVFAVAVVLGLAMEAKEEFADELAACGFF